MNTQELLSRPQRPIRIGDAINLSLNLAEKKQGLSFGIPAGFPSLDSFTQGWNAGELTVIGARPAVGKTLLALAMARNASVGFGVPTAYFSLETSSIQLTNRLIASESGVPSGKVCGGDLIDKDDWQRMETSLHKISKAPLYIDDSPCPRMGELEERIKGMVLNQGVRLAFIDCFSLIQPDEDSLSLPRGKQLEDHLRRLKETAVESGTAIIVLTSVRRPIRRNYSGPVLIDLDPFCPMAEDYAEKIILLHRPSIYGLDFKAEGKDIMELRIAKNKDGFTGTADLVFDPERLRLSDRGYDNPEGMFGC